MMMKDLRSPNDSAKNITDNATQHPLIEKAYFKYPLQILDIVILSLLLFSWLGCEEKK